MELEDAIHTALLTLKEGFEGARGGARRGWRAQVSSHSAAARGPQPTRARLPACSLAGELSGDNIEVAVVGEDRKFRVLTPAEVSDYLQEVE